MSFESLTPPPQNERRPEPRIVFSQTAGPTSEPVSASDLRAHAHLDDNDDTAALERLIIGARAYVESQTGRVLAQQTWTAKLERWPDPDPFDGRIRIRLSPAPASITSVTVDGVTLGASVYTLLGDELLIGSELETFPEGDDVADGIVITFAAQGAAASFPQLKLAMLMLAAHWHRNPEATHTFEAGLTPLPFGVGALLASARVMRELN